MVIMCSLLTQHVRNFGPDQIPGDEVRGRLLSLLRRQMHRHGLLGQAPSLLGYTDISSWRQEGAFDDILRDCYLYAILGRLAEGGDVAAAAQGIGETVEPPGWTQAGGRQGSRHGWIPSG
jgi:hypothetical protein